MARRATAEILADRQTVLHAIEELTFHGRRHTTPCDVSRVTGIPKTTLSRHFKALEQDGAITRAFQNRAISFVVRVRQEAS